MMASLMLHQPVSEQEKYRDLNSHVETSLRLRGICALLGLCSIQLHWQDESLVHLELCAGTEIVAIADDVLEVTEVLVGFEDPVGHLIVEIDDAAKSAAKVVEGVHRPLNLMDCSATD
ncbi:unnamed protein product [Schistocephalus solidus]|uniref:Uncharacterized protein n=1 Tax=Schistocephalus solidus TaxID=70667 RepID=A0A183S844_SCHSO|nr:unnamed protein product [Schistocephalus solidus]